MKKLSWVHHFFSEIRLSSVIVFIVITVSMLSVSLVSGMLRYRTYAANAIRSQALEKSVYVMTGANRNRGSDASAVMEKIQAYDCVQSILSVKVVNTFQFHDQYVSILLYSDEMLEVFPLRTKKSFDLDTLKNPAGDSIPVIVGSQIFDGAGSDRFPLQMIAKGKSSELTVNPVAQLKYPYMPITFSGAGSEVSADDLFSSTHCLIAYESEDLLAFFRRHADITLSTNFFVLFQPGASEGERGEVLSYLETVGSYASYETITANTARQIQSDLKQYLPIPCYFVFLSLVSLFSTAVITVSKKMKDAAVFQICGMSKRRLFFSFLEAMSILYGTAAGLNLAFILSFALLKESHFFDFSTYLLDGQTALLVIGYAVLLLFVTSAVPLIVIGRGSPIQVLRRVE